MPDVPAHSDTRHLSFAVHFPEHEPRHASHLFEQTRTHLIHDLNVGCWVGGATVVDLRSGLSPSHRCCGATQLEAHHAMVEWADWNGIDWTKVAKDFPLLGIHDDDSFRKAAESENGLLILCDKHHRSKGAGIHMVDYPSWLPERYALDDFRFLG